MKLHLIYFTFLFIGLSTVGFSQQGFINGVIDDEITGEKLPGVRVMVKNHKIGAYSDLDGGFDISLPSGTYDLQVTYMGYDTLTVSEVVVKSNETTGLAVLKIKSQVSDFEEVVISANRKTNTENAILSLKQKSTNMIDGMSSAKFRKTGDSDAGSAMRRIPGVSLSDGKYIFIRGIGDRYSKTLLNGLEVPGLDPDRNTVQMDIFPTKIIDNIVVYKSASADLPADFAGGLIDITLNSAATESTRSISMSTAFNPNYHFKSNYLTYEKSGADVMALGKDSRAIPAENNIPFFAETIADPNGAKAKRYKQILGSFDPQLAAMESSSMMDIGIDVNVGDLFKKKGYTIGYNFNVSYKNETQFFEDALFSRYGLSNDRNENKLELRELQKGNYGENNVLLSGMFGLTLNTKRSKYNFNLLHLQNGTSTAGIFDYDKTDQGAVFSGFQHNLEYAQRSLSNVIISGSHKFTGSDWSLDWASSTSLSSIDNPDIRFTRYEERSDGSFNIGTESGFPERIWRELNEINTSAKVDLSKKIKLFGNEGQFKFGAVQNYKKRDFKIRSFQINVRNVELTGDPNELFAEENLWPYNGDISKGTTFETPFIPVNPNQFESSVLSTGVYGLTEISPVDRLKIVLGLRTELYSQKYTGRDQLGTNVLNNDVVLEELGFFPSMNVVYAVSEKQNIRMSYGRTTARPSFKELSYSEILDPITGRTFIGGLFRDANDVLGVEYWDGNLVSTSIHNFDLRWEMFHGRGQTFSISGFYKMFNNPIEVVQFATQAGAFQPRNVGNGTVLGLELEARQSLDFIAKKLSNFNLAMNVTLTQSQIELSATEYESRVTNARSGQEISEFRDMAGQAPWIINGGIEYKGNRGFGKNLAAGVYYNVQGETLLFSGIADRPDIYTVPFHGVNMNVSKSFGKKDQFNAGIMLKNITNAKKEAVFKSYEAEDQYFFSIRQGTTVSLKMSYNF
ncbi:TonB-dependent receptor [Brumimicrobium glaciale]|uniref:TonB-dependent receptor n=1 Tax=Brumimicrobium glaciale TaxID=200475 RepID=A0A4Q4KR14_9FLAO|nr:TonB-dependent receptor [Brumimicrobium glaciale]RYM35970.1 TonB-dependent receptor [Brumimicrobium glaciale]